MRFLMTLSLGLLTAGGAAWWYWHDHARTTIEAAHSSTTDKLKLLSPDAIVAIEVGDARMARDGENWVLDQGMPDGAAGKGGWPTRGHEVQSLVKTLSSLDSRFEPLPRGESDQYGLAPSQHPVTVNVKFRRSDGTIGSSRLTFGRPTPSGENPFACPTYLQVDEAKEVLRLAPGVMDQVRKGRSDFMRRQLFADAVRAKIDPGADAGPIAMTAPAAALLEADELQVTSAKGTWKIRRSSTTPLKVEVGKPIRLTSDRIAERWELAEPVSDRVDPNAIRDVLTAVPDLWAEDNDYKARLKNVNRPATDNDTTGLDKPEYTVTVRSGGREAKLLIGKRSWIDEKPSPPRDPRDPNPPQPPQREEFRYARLAEHPAVFEVRTDRFDRLFLPPASLRDAQLARFKSSDVKKVEVSSAGHKITFEKEAGAGERWKILDPASPAEGQRVTELIQKLEQLQARDKNVIDNKEPKSLGLAADDPATTVALTVAETPPAEATGPNQAVERVVTYRFGKPATEPRMVYVQVAGSRRANAVADDVLDLVNRDVFAYRSRRVIDVPAANVTRIAVERPADGFILAKNGGAWSLTAPVAVPVDATKAASLAGDLAQLLALGFIKAKPSDQELKEYGLAEPSLKVVIDVSEPAAGKKTLLVGTAVDKSWSYAKLDGDPVVFAINKSLRDALDQPSLALRSLQLWDSAAGMQGVEVTREDGAFSLTRKNGDDREWELRTPVVAKTDATVVRPWVDALSAPRAQRFVQHTAEDLGKFGLDKPVAIVKVKMASPRTGEAPANKELRLGKRVELNQQSYYATCSEQPGVLVVGEGLAVAADKPAKDLVDPQLLSIDPAAISRLECDGPDGRWSARKKSATEWVIDSLNPPATADSEVIKGLVQTFASARAQRFAELQTQDLATFGLDKPTTKISATVDEAGAKVTRTVALGKPSAEGVASRFARVDETGPIAVLPIATTLELSRSATELIDRRVLTFDAGELIGLRRTGTGPDLELEKKEGAWRMTKPEAAVADVDELNGLAERLSQLRADKVEAVAPADLARYGLDKPQTSVTLTLTSSGGPRALVIQLGGTAMPSGRYARVGSGPVVVLPEFHADAAVAKLLSPPWRFRERTLAQISGVDRFTVTRGPRAMTFAKVLDRWRMTAPAQAEAESADVDQLLQSLRPLRAAELVADQTGDLKSYGLDPPEGELTFYQADRAVGHLLVGRKDVDGSVFVKPAGGSFVGRLDAAAGGRFVAEYRSRTPWGTIPAQQADNLILNSGAGGTPLILRKSPTGEWEVAEQPETAVKLKVVNELVTTLGNLKIDHYAVDQKADLKAHGLDPAERVIVIKARGGDAVTLHVGKFDGDSKRAFISVPGADWVGVLSEADSAKLVRPLADFTGR